MIPNTATPTIWATAFTNSFVVVYSRYTSSPTLTIFKGVPPSG